MRLFDRSSQWNASKIAVNRNRAGLPQVHVHDLKHTFGRRLRETGVSFEDRQDLVGHKSGRITTHYSRAELHNLITAANRVCEAEWTSRRSEDKTTSSATIISACCWADCIPSFSFAAPLLQ